MNDKRWTTVELAKSGAEVLCKRGFESPRLESDLLLAHVLGVERLELYTRFDMPIDDRQRGVFRDFIKRRLRHEPVAYILGEKDFLDLTFKVAPGILIPRPETEHVVQAGSTFLSGIEHPRFIEVGVGSGCISLSLLHKHPEAVALGFDISEKALDCALENARHLGLADRFICAKSDVFSALPAQPAWGQGIDLIISNPPYIRRDEMTDLPRDVADFEPPEALFCPEDGLSFHRRILSEGRGLLTEKGGIVLELADGTGAKLAKYAAELSADALNAYLPDYAGLDRVFCHTKNVWPERFSGLHRVSASSEEESGEPFGDD